MSEPRLISPLLDNIIMGDPISCHDGIRCCPAMDKNTEEKFIVKIISVPASQTQLDALLLTGAFADHEEAKSYFENRAKEIVAELDHLQELSRLEGFIPANGYQIVPMEQETGFEIYILTPYRRSLEKHIEKTAMTRLGALNLALDVCAALTAARRNGYLYINLKPSNLFMTANGEFKIGDLGLMKLNSLHYATIADHYISRYTPPEITDAFSRLNTTMDVYAIGMILYGIYNGGELPSDQEISPPQYADEELAQIILNAIASQPDERIQSPAELGQLIVSYIQKNGVEDCPVVPVSPVITEEPAENNAAEQASAEKAAEIPDTHAQNAIADTAVEAAGDVTQDIPDEAVPSSDHEESVAESSNVTAPVVAEESVTDETGEVMPPVIDNVESDDSEAAQVEAALPTTDTDSGLSEDYTAADDIASITDDANVEEIPYSEVSSEVSEILAQADELAAMEVPDPVVAPDPISVELPPVEAEDVTPVTEDASQTAGEDESSPVPVDDVPGDEDFDDQDKPDAPKFSWKRLILPFVALLILIGGFLFYRFYVLQTIEEIQVIGNKDQLTVVLTTKTDEELLTISCTDIYGKKIIVPVIDGRAEFTGLLPDTEYNVQAHIDGLHVLTGKTEATYFTPNETSIVQFSVVTGNISGTAILSFTVSGPNSDSWKFTYATNVGAEKTVTFDGNTVTLTDLEENKFYSGVLEPVDDLFITESPEITFTASEIIQAGNLMFTDCTDGKLSVAWTAPESVIVESWNVRCSNGIDFEETQTVTDTQATFNVSDNTNSFTVEVTAAGQSVSQRVTLGENSVTIKNVEAEVTENGKIDLSWDSSREIQDGWIISYTVNGSEAVFNIPAAQNSALITPAIPDSTYTITILAADATATVCPPYTLQTNEVENFQVNYSGNLVTMGNLHFSMCKRPGMNWSHQDLAYSDYTNSFSVGELAGFVVFVDRRYDISNEDIVTAFVICDENGHILTIDTNTRTWSNMWYKNYCQLNIPHMPDEPGNYTISIYFNGQFANKQAFSVV